MWFQVHETAWIVLHNYRHQAAESLLYILSTNCPGNLNQSTKSVPKYFFKMHLWPQSQHKNELHCTKTTKSNRVENETLKPYD